MNTAVVSFILFLSEAEGTCINISGFSKAPLMVVTFHDDSHCDSWVLKTLILDFVISIYYTEREWPWHAARTHAQRSAGDSKIRTSLAWSQMINWRTWQKDLHNRSIALYFFFVCFKITVSFQASWHMQKGSANVLRIYIDKGSSRANTVSQAIKSLRFRNSS